jgi:hypothetical protein
MFKCDKFVLEMPHKFQLKYLPFINQGKYPSVLQAKYINNALLL